MGKRHRLFARGDGYVEKAIALANAPPEETQADPEKMKRAALMVAELMSQLGTMGTAKSFPRMVRKLRDIQSKEGNRFMSETESNSLKNEVVNEIIEEKQAKIIKREGSR